MFKNASLAGLSLAIIVHLWLAIGALVLGPVALWHIAHRNVVRHRRAMQLTYGAAVMAGVFALLPSRYMASLLWHHTLGLI